MICPKCGKSLVENSTICNFCGFQIPVSKENFIKQYKKDNYPYNIDKVMRLVIFIFFAWFIIGIILVCSKGGKSFNDFISMAILPLVLELISCICYCIFRAIRNDKLKTEANKKYDETFKK